MAGARQFGLIGYPLHHSFSKAYFAAKFAREGLSGYTYDLFPLEEISQFPDLLRTRAGLRGLNVTIPYKEAILPYLHELSAEASAIRAVNAIDIRGDFLKGYNTDAFGFEKSLLDWLGRPLPAGLKALVFGTGGASKAVAYVLKRLAIPFYRVSRAKGLGDITYDDLDADAIREHRLLVNTTPLGMYPKPNDRPAIPYEGVGPGHFLYDLVYNPEKTVFLIAGEQRGARILNGLPMLHLQAEQAWHIWMYQAI